MAAIIVILVDVTNEKGVLSKDFGNMIPAGTILEYEEIPERVDQLLQIGVVAIGSDQDPEIGENDPGAPEQHPDAFLSLLDQSADKAIKSITGDLSGAQLDLLMAHEMSNKDRKTVKEHIKALLGE